MTDIEGIGKNVEKAIEDALFQLKASREDVDIKIIDQGGFMRKAKVLVSISEDAISKYQKKEEKKVLKEVTSFKEKEDKKEEEAVLDVKSLFIKVEEKKQKEAAIESKKETKTEDKEEKKAKKEYKKSEGTGAIEFIKRLIEEMGIEGANIEESESEETRKIEVKGNGVGKMVGHRGETLGAIQTIVSAIDRNDNEGGKRLMLDVDGYLEKREQTLIGLAGRMAKKVNQTGRPARLEPMTANERRIVHTALQDEEGVTTISKGQEPNRYLMIIPKNN